MCIIHVLFLDCQKGGNNIEVTFIICVHFVFEEFSCFSTDWIFSHIGTEYEEKFQKAADMLISNVDIMSNRNYFYIQEAIFYYHITHLVFIVQLIVDFHENLCKHQSFVRFNCFSYFKQYFSYLLVNTWSEFHIVLLYAKPFFQLVNYVI